MRDARYFCESIDFGAAARAGSYRGGHCDERQNQLHPLTWVKPTREIFAATSDSEGGHVRTNIARRVATWVTNDSACRGTGALSAGMDVALAQRKHRFILELRLRCVIRIVQLLPVLRTRGVAQEVNRHPMLADFEGIVLDGYHQLRRDRGVGGQLHGRIHGDQPPTRLECHVEPPTGWISLICSGDSLGCSTEELITVE